MIDLFLIAFPGGTELLVILLIVLILFGAKRIPEIAQGLGRGIKEFKKSVKDVQSEIESDSTPTPKIDQKPENTKPDAKDE
jgi:sec-independent protein translocase protein TatA